MAAPVDIGTLIERTPGVVGGRPRIAGRRLTVRNIAGMHNAGDPPEEILRQYPQLSLAEVHAALAYYYANQAEIDEDIAEEARFYDEMAKQYPPLRDREPDPAAR